MSSSNTHKLIVGVDYGTTFTGVSFVSSAHTANDVQVIRTWPGPARDQDETWKTPSRIAYRSENNSIGQGNIAWGYQVTPKMKAYSWTKLLLDSPKSHIKGTDGMNDIDGGGLLRLPFFKSEAREVVSDFLREIYRYTISYLERRFTREVLAETPIDFWFTVPAMWSDKAKQNTYDAAGSAGFGARPNDTINMITEPEAAAISALSTPSIPNDIIKPGNGVLICDCGGGTVDIISYMITAVHPTLKFDELLIGVGEKCGSTYIDRNFHKWMSEKFGPSFDDLSFEKKGPGSRLMKGFEAEKRDFGTPGTLNKIFEVDLVMPNVPSSANYNAEDGTVLFTSADMKSFFDPVTLQILKLLEGQIIQSRTGCATQVKAVVLVGGFGDSLMLYQDLEAWCVKENLKLICENNPQASVVKGAALRGLSTIRPDKRKSRLHYGTVISLPFRDGIDDEKDSYIHEWNGEKYCHGRMGWVIKKGQSFDQDEELPSLALSESHYQSQKLTFTIELYTCSEDQPPDHYDRDTCLHVGTICYEFHGKDLSQFPNKRDKKNRKMWLLDYDLAFDLLEAKGILNFKILGPGKRSLGQTTIEYN